MEAICLNQNYSMAEKGVPVVEFGYTLANSTSEGVIPMDWITDPATWIAFLTLVALELVLGVDNVIFISILAGKLPQEQQKRARTTGIMLAVVTRILLLLSLTWIIGLTDALFSIYGFDISGRDLVLFAGGLFLLWKSVHEIHQKLEGEEGQSSAKVRAAFWSVIIQIMLLDIVFSLDSVITAVGMVDEIAIMIAAVVISAIVMVFTSGPLSEFCRAPSDDQDAGVELPAADRFYTDRRSPAPAYSQGIHLLCHGLLGLGRDAQPAPAENTGKASRPA